MNQGSRELIMNWKKYHCYRVFDEFLEGFVLGRKSYITKHPQSLDLDAGLNEIRSCFVNNFDESEEFFESKVQRQFIDATDNAKIIFLNAEYLWAMPTHQLREYTKAEYPRRWFNDSDLHSGSKYYFEGDHTVAGTGSYYTRNKFYEICAIIQLLTHLNANSSLASVSEVKGEVEEFIYRTIYGNEPSNKTFHTERKCSIRNMLLHLSNPDKYESIVSYGDKDRIIRVFSHVLADSDDLAPEAKIKAIRSAIYPHYGNTAPEGYKERWFFYQEDILPLWKEKTPTKCKETSIRLEIQEEENAGEPEGEKTDTKGKTIKRSSALVKQVKQRDNYSCLACGFHYKKEIVQAHHLDPISERKKPKLTKRQDLVTLCPNCHYLAHHLLRRSNKYKQQDTLLGKLKELNDQIHSEQGAVL